MTRSIYDMSNDVMFTACTVSYVAIRTDDHNAMDAANAMDAVSDATQDAVSAAIHDATREALDSAIR